MKKSFRFRKLINWAVQGPIVLRIIAHLVSYNIALFVLLLAAWSISNLMGSFANQSATPVDFVVRRNAGLVLFCMAVMTPFMVWDLILLTNRIAGPLYRFEALMKDFVKSGTLKQAKLRDGDLLTGFQKQYNEFVEALHALYPETVPTATSATMTQTTTVPEQSGVEQTGLQDELKTATGLTPAAASTT